MALATAEQVRALVPGLSSADDATIGVVLARIDASFARYCGHPTPDSGAHTMEAAAYTMYPGRYDIGTGDDRNILVLPCPPVLSVTSVHVDPDQDYGADTLLGASEYVADGRRLELLVGATAGWSTSPRANKVVASAGYTVADHPVLTEAAITQAAHLTSNTSAAGSTSTSTRGGGSRSIAPLSLLSEVREMLARYVLAVP